NRLASNSLLEAVVFGLRAGRAMSSHAEDPVVGAAEQPPILVPDMLERQIRDLTWEQCGIVRERAGLECAISALNGSQWVPAAQPSLAAIELRNIHQVAALIANSALWREESRGAHFRTDFPEKRREFEQPSRVSISRIPSSNASGLPTVKRV